MRMLGYFGWWTSTDVTGNEGLDMGNHRKMISSSSSLSSEMSRWRKVTIGVGRQSISLVDWWDWDDWGKNLWLAQNLPSSSKFNRIEHSDPRWLAKCGWKLIERWTCWPWSLKTEGSAGSNGWVSEGCQATLVEARWSPQGEFSPQ